MRILAVLLAAQISCLALDCTAAPFAVRLGIEKIALDAPPGFTDATNLASPRLQDFAENVNTPSNRILLFGLTDADMRRFQLGDKLDFNRFVMISTPRALEQQRVVPDQFAALVTDIVAMLGKPAQFTDLVKYLESQPVGRSSLLEELRREPAAVSIMQATRLEPVPGYRFYERSKPQYLVFTTTQLLVRNRVLQVMVFSLSETGVDLDWMRGATQRWVNELQRINPR